MNPNFIKYLLAVTGASDCQEIETIQSLWSGYGRIARFRLERAALETVVVKFIALNQSTGHPRGWNSQFGHDRKVKSYAVETHWYEQWSERCTEDCRVPKLIGSFAKGNDQWIILEDLNLLFPDRRHQLELYEIKVCLQWLANFHVTFLQQAPAGLWQIGTYWHLDTRPDELTKIEHKELQAKAHLVDELLNQCKYKTIVHGDAKLANFCFSADGKKVAAVDFQYVGGGCGMKDVAYFLGSCLSNHELELYHDELLSYYFSKVKQALTTSQSNIDPDALEQEWRELYPVACTDFTRFLLGWMPTHQKINSYNLNMLKTVLSKL